MSTPLITPPFQVPFYNRQTQDIDQQWKRYLLELTNQIALAFAPADGSYVVTDNVPGLPNQFDLSLLSPDGILKQTVALGVATPAIALAGTDYTNLAFKTIAVSGQSDIVADSAADLLTIAAGSNITLTTNAGTDTLTIAAAASGGTVTTTGSPSSGDIAKFSGATLITNATAGTDYTALAFKTIAVATQSDIVADTPADTLTIVAGTGVTLTTSASTDTLTIAASGTQTKVITVTVDGQGVVLTTGVKGYFQVPVSCTIVSWTILSVDATPTSGAIVFDIWSVAYGSYPPVVGNSITPSAKPTITASGIKNTSTSVGAWTTAVTAGDCWGINIDSVSSFKKVVLEVVVTVP